MFFWSILKASFEFLEPPHARQCSNKFGITLAYSLLSEVLRTNINSSSAKNECSIIGIILSVNFCGFCVNLYLKSSDKLKLVICKKWMLHHWNNSFCEFLWVLCELIIIHWKHGSLRSEVYVTYLESYPLTSHVRDPNVHRRRIRSMEGKIPSLSTLWAFPE